MRFQEVVRAHYPAPLFALIAGFLTVVPYLLTLHTLGSAYQDIPPMYADNEDYYIARTREIFDGHFSVASPFYYEYKNILPVVPPVGEYLLAAITITSGLSLLDAVILAKFLLPAALFLFIYALALLLIRERAPDPSPTALAAATLVVLGIGLVDYAGVLSRLFHEYSDVAVTLWARPVNPITGALLLFPFLIFMFKAREGGFAAATAAGVILAIMAGYVFSFAASIGVLGALFLIALAFRQWDLCARYIATGGVALCLVAAYALAVLPYLKGGGGLEKSGLIVGHAPILNKFVLAAAITLAALFAMARRNGIAVVREKERHAPLWFCVALVAGGFIAFNQQVLTGATIWPPHLMQYTAPLSIVAVISAGAIVLSNRYQRIWKTLLRLVIASSFAFAVWNASTYVNGIESTRATQRYAPVLAWLRGAAQKDCVALVADDEIARLTNLIPAHTPCNVYMTTHISSAIPSERITHNYLVLLRLRGVTAERVKEYLLNDPWQLQARFYNDWRELYGPPESNLRILELAEEVGARYREFLKKDFAAEVRRYRADYLLDEGLLDPSAAAALSAKKIFEDGGITVYALPR